jgi:hypothetical protein
MTKERGRRNKLTKALMKFGDEMTVKTVFSKLQEAVAFSKEDRENRFAHFKKMRLQVFFNQWQGVRAYYKNLERTKESI